VTDQFHQRRTPAKRVHISLSGLNWVFLTVCTKDRERWLAQARVQRSLHEIWLHTADAWLVCDFLLMPDHLHLFCAPGDPDIAIERWITFWKSQLTKALPGLGQFQRAAFHHRLRTEESYAQKWQYVRENPVRAGLVGRPEDWPFQGRVHEICW
jgi:putative transposase